MQQYVLQNIHPIEFNARTELVTKFLTNEMKGLHLKWRTERKNGKNLKGTNKVNCQSLVYNRKFSW